MISLLTPILLLLGLLFHSVQAAEDVVLPRATRSCSDLYGDWSMYCASASAKTTVQMCYTPSLGDSCCSNGNICYGDSSCVVGFEAGDPYPCCPEDMTKAECTRKNSAVKGKSSPTTTAAGADRSKAAAVDRNSGLPSWGLLGFGILLL